MITESGRLQTTQLSAVVLI